ncbi:phosphotransferase enzyme family protein [Streptomyces sp. PT12]|uniref:phosphotransferase enzyme family protein n=1 Tax=Streptomyces sp. PT12 TaxID=1510197 RepID=UPI000DE4B000|nr:phosphotransferase [Streptomyces sp. PT12]RBM21191.1 aminoglycoside phosphotransferase [Streptomyces sp. PT12]
MPHAAYRSQLPATELVAHVLAQSYGLPRACLDRLDGQVSVNYRATADDGSTVFVKHYVDAADLASAPDVIAQTRRAGEHGVPVASVVPSTSGEAITVHDGVALSVWEWMPGHTVETGLNRAQQTAAGRALGRIHAAFAPHPASDRPSAKARKWLTPDLAKRRATIERLLAIIGERDERGERDAFDERAAVTLTERRAQLDRLNGLHLPSLHTQALHGDYSVKNLHFEGDSLTAVVDFGPPEPFLAAWELGRIAFDVRSVVHDPDWIATGTTLVSAYLEENPRLPAADVTSCARVALIQLLTSLYGVKEHYLAPGLHQDDLDLFWLQRHEAATRLLGSLAEAESALADLTP